MDASVEFVAVDNPHATRLKLHVLAAVAEHEREMIADRTKAALGLRRRAASGLAVTAQSILLRHIARRPSSGRASSRLCCWNCKPPACRRVRWRQS